MQCFYHSDYEIKLPGEHQIKNTSVAIVAAKLVSKQDDRINELALHVGVANTVWPGRLERIHKNPDIILDVRTILTVPRLCVMLWINTIPASRCSLSLA